MITTAGTTRENIFDEIYEYANGVLDGTIKNDAFFPLLYELDSPDEWMDSTCWKKANPALGTIKQYKYLAEMVQLAKDSPSRKKGVLCKDFNIRQNDQDKWITFDIANNEEMYNIEAYFTPKTGKEGIG